MIKKEFYFIFSLLILSLTGWGQGFNFSLTGNPVNTTGWTMSSQSSVNGGEIDLTQPTTSQAGYIYFSTPQNLANCSQFTVTFDFRITNSSIPPADGIAFWYITNPPSNFVVGGGIGLPSNPNGLLLVLDTYNNNGLPDDNPIVSLRRMNGNASYVEGDNNGTLTPDLTYQSFITDGNWHTCQLIYNFGTVTVSFDGGAPVMTGNTTLSINGYFGFSAGTGASWSLHAIRNVTISGAPEPAAPTADTTYYCQYEAAAPLEAHPDSNLLWYTDSVGGTALAQTPVPSTATPGTFTYYVSQIVPGCNIESQRSPVIVVIHPQPDPPVISVPSYCSGQTGINIQNPSTAGQIRWYESDTGTAFSTAPPSINTTNAGTQTYYVSQTNEFGCESLRSPVDILVRQSPEADFDFELGLDCSGQDTVHFNNLSQGNGSYFWNFGVPGLIVTDTSTNPTFVYPGAGTYFVELTVSNGNCVDSVFHPVELGHPLHADFLIDDDTICLGTNIQLTNNSVATTVNGTTAHYSWDFGDGTTSTDLNPTHTYNHPGTYQIKLVAFNAVPCADSMIKTVTVDSPPLSSLIAKDTSICMGDHIDFVNLHSEDGFTGSLWNFGDGSGLVEASDTTNHAFDHAGTFMVRVTNNYRACPATQDSIIVRIEPMPDLNFGTDSTLCLGGDPIVLTDQINQNNPNARWRWNTGDTTPTLVVTHPGVYSLTVSVEKCTITEYITVTKNCYLDIPNSFTPNGDGVNDYFLPRQLLSKGVTGFKLAVWNRWGQKIFETESLNGRGWDGRFNGKDQPVGVYVYAISVVYENGKSDNYTGNITLLR